MMFYLSFCLLNHEKTSTSFVIHAFWFGSSRLHHLIIIIPGLSGRCLVIRFCFFDFLFVLCLIVFPFLSISSVALFIE